MTPDKATALWAAAKDGAWAERRRGARGYAELSEIAKINRFRALADPPTILALLEERERLRGALETIRDIAGTHGGLEPDYSRLDRIDATARQALEATDDQ